jgi:ABC-type uncharacterized transport system permease subunit
MGLRQEVSKFAYSAVAVVIALIIGAVLIGASGYSVKEAYSNLFMGAFGGVYSLATLRKGRQQGLLPTGFGLQ